MSRPLRILVTGSRSWRDRATIRAALGDALGTYATIGLPVLVHGRCPDGGADLLADQVWRELLTARPGWLAEPEMHDARRFPSFKARNQHMVDQGATVCLAFATAWASGTGQTARMARAAGIPTRDYGVPTAMKDRP